MLSALLLSLLAQCSQLGPVLSCPRPPPANPWAYWTLNDASDGTFHDSGPNGLDLTVTANGAYPVRADPWRAFTRKDTTGIMAQASNYGTRTLIPPAIVHLATQADITVGFSFIRAPLDGGSGLEEPLALGEGVSDAFEVRIARTAGTCSANAIELVFTDSGSASRTICFNTYAVADGVRFHAAIVMDPTSAGHFTPRLYIDGVLKQSGSEQLDPLLFTQPLTDGGTVSISLRRTLLPAAGQVGGLMRNVAIYPRVLTASEIQDLAAQ